MQLEPKPGLAGDAGEATGETIEGILTTAREMLSMDIAYLSEFDAGYQRVRHVQGDAGSFGLTPGTEIALPDTYCQRMVRGEIPNAVCDTSEDPVLSRLEVTRTADLAAYLAVPIELSNGELYGTLCCADHEAKRLGDREVRFLGVLGRLIGQAIERERESARIARARARAQALEALIASLEARDQYTGDHSASVVELATACARRLGLSHGEIEDVRQAALLHDIGKIGVPDTILRKPGRLTEEEWVVMRRHSEIGEQIIGSIESLRHLAPLIRAEHERYDGRGYPDGLEGDEIPLGSRIVLACDAYHAMVSDRPYRPALPVEAAIRELRANAGTQFDPAVVEALLASVESVTEAARAPGGNGRAGGT